MESKPSIQNPKLKRIQESKAKNLKSKARDLESKPKNTGSKTKNTGSKRKNTGTKPKNTGTNTKNTGPKTRHPESKATHLKSGVKSRNPLFRFPNPTVRWTWFQTTNNDCVTGNSRLSSQRSEVEVMNVS